MREGEGVEEDEGRDEEGQQQDRSGEVDNGSSDWEEG